MKRKSIITNNIIILLLIILLGQVLIYIKINLTDKTCEKTFKQNVVFYPQHQDDEVLWGASAILRAIETCGQDNIYVVLVADGLGVNVFNNNEYKNMTNEEKKEIRDKEFKSALSQLGVKEENIIILSDINKENEDIFELMEKTILEFENSLENVTHISHHYEYDDHPMHIKNGQVLKNLKDEGKVKDALYFIKPQYLKSIPVKNRVIYKVKNKSEYNKVKKACYEYKRVDIENDSYGVGYTSSPRYFDNLLKTLDFKSILSNK